MPRSTGGGSHSGGYHSSSHSSSSSHSTGGGSHSSGFSSRSSYSSSSRSSYSSSYHSGFTSGSTRSTPIPPPPRPRRSPIVSNKHFDGAQRYVYYRNDRPQYVYTNYQKVRREKHNGRLIFYICFVLMLIVGFHDLYSPPKKLEPASTRIVIEDNLRILGDQTDIRSSLTSFLDKTGVTPAIITLTNESWSRHFSSLSNKAYELYVNTFRDEKHWLIVYSESTEKDQQFVNWFWEGIGGDDTEDILTDEVVDFFGERLQKYLLMDSFSTGEAIRQAFDDTTGIVMETGKYDESDIPSMLVIIFGFIALGLWRSGYWPGRQKRPKDLPKDAIPDNKPLVQEPVQQTIPQKPVEIACAYCGSLMPEGMMRCPHCGAARTKQA